MSHNTAVFCIIYVNTECTLTTFPKFNVFNFQGNLGDTQIEDFPSSHCCFSVMTTVKGGLMQLFRQEI